MMEPINYDIDPGATPQEKMFLTSERGKKQLSTALKNKLNLVMGMFIVLTVTIILTTDLHITSALELAAVSLMFIVLTLGSYLMYINTSSAGGKAGLNTEIYRSAKKRHDELRTEIISKQLQGILPEFCQKYVEQELRGTRGAILANVGIAYEKYEEEWLGKDDKTINNDKSLSDATKKAICEANNTKPILLTPDMFFKGDRGRKQRNPVGRNPQATKLQNYILRFISILAMSAVPAVVVLEMTAGITWATFASICLKLLPLGANAFLGYEFGFKNIVINTVNYLEDQSDLMCEVLSWVTKKDNLCNEKAGE